MSVTSAIHDDRRLPALTGLRFLAALAVIVSHLSERSFIGPYPALVEFLDGGRTAVALFFVLSGFVLAYNYGSIGAPGSRRSFYVARVARIYPTVLLALAVAAIGVAYAYVNRADGLLLDRFALSNHVEPLLAVSLVAQLLMLTGWIPVASINQPWNGPAWSISCEIFFYALFPALIIWLRRKPPRYLAIVVVVAFAAQAVFVWGLAPLTPINQAGFLATQFPVPHLVEFLCGIVAALAYQRGAREWLRVGRRRTVLLVAALVPLILLAAFQPVFPADLPATPFFTLLVLALAIPPTRRRSWLAWPPLLLLGEASFALYLLHIPVLNVLAIWPPAQTLGWLWLALLIGLSILVFHSYETPARRLVRRVLTPQAPQPAEPRGRLLGR